MQLFTPYATVQEELPEVRTSLKELLERARRRREPAYLFVNNRLEGNSPMTIMSIVDVEDEGRDLFSSPPAVDELGCFLAPGAELRRHLTAVHEQRRSR